MTFTLEIIELNLVESGLVKYTEQQPHPGEPNVSLSSSVRYPFEKLYISNKMCHSCDIHFSPPLQAIGLLPTDVFKSRS